MARHFAESMIGHRNSLAGKAEDAVKAQYALHQTATGLTDQFEDQRKASKTVLEHWKGDNSEGFEKRSNRLGRQLRVTADAARDAEKIVAGVTSALTTGHARARQAVDEYLDRAARLLDAGKAVGTQAALLKAVAQAADLEPRYTKETTAAVRHARGELEDAARKLRALEKEVEHDGVADGRAERTRGRTKPSRARARGVSWAPGRTRPAATATRTGRRRRGARRSPRRCGARRGWTSRSCRSPATCSGGGSGTTRRTRA
jgi:hypothetical protein